MNLDTSNVTDFYATFQNCYNLEEVNGLTASNATNFSDADGSPHMFENCYNLSKVGINDVSRRIRLYNTKVEKPEMLDFINNRLSTASAASQFFDMRYTPASYYMLDYNDRKPIYDKGYTDFGSHVHTGMLYLEAGSTFSYPGSGTTWTEIGKGTPTNNATISGPTYVSGTQSFGHFLFDGTNDVITFADDEMFRQRHYIEMVVEPVTLSGTQSLFGRFEANDDGMKYRFVGNKLRYDYAQVSGDNPSTHRYKIWDYEFQTGQKYLISIYDNTLYVNGEGPISSSAQSISGSPWIAPLNTNTSVSIGGNAQLNTEYANFKLYAFYYWEDGTSVYDTTAVYQDGTRFALKEIYNI